MFNERSSCFRNSGKGPSFVFKPCFSVPLDFFHNTLLKPRVDTVVKRRAVLFKSPSSPVPCFRVRPPCWTNSMLTFSLEHRVHLRCFPSATRCSMESHLLPRLRASHRWISRIIHNESFLRHVINWLQILVQTGVLPLNQATRESGQLAGKD